MQEKETNLENVSRETLINSDMQEKETNLENVSRETLINSDKTDIEEVTLNKGRIDSDMSKVSAEMMLYDMVLVNWEDGTANALYSQEKM
jgi:inorganic pyrophosphatase/exopolyphosphatase